MLLNKLNQLVLIECIVTNGGDTFVDTYNLPPTLNINNAPIWNKHTTHSKIEKAPIQHNPFYVPLPIPEPINHASSWRWRLSFYESYDMAQDAPICIPNHELFCTQAPQNPTFLNT